MEGTEERTNETLVEKEQSAPQTQERSAWVDVAKGVGVCLVFLGHLWYYTDFPLLNQMIYSFHVPMFFLLSGWVLRRKAGENFLTYVGKKFMRMLLPAIIYLVLTVPLYLCFDKPSTPGIALETIFFYRGQIAYNLPCWYFIILFGVLVLERAFNVKRWHVIGKILLAAACFVGGFFLYQSDVFVPFGVDKTVMSLGFLVTGMVMKEVTEKIRLTPVVHKIVLAVIFAVSVAGWVVFGVLLNPKISFYSVSLGNYWYFLPGALFGSVWFFVLCYALAKYLKFLIPVGNSTILIVGTHYVFVRGLFSMADMLQIRWTGVFGVIAVVSVVVLTVLYVLVNKPLSKYVPWLVGAPIRKKKTPAAERVRETIPAEKG